MTKTKSQSHARKELDILIKSNSFSSILNYEHEIDAIVEAFHNRGHSGSSAEYESQLISKVLENLFRFRPITPLTGNDNEWNNLTEINDGQTLFQNNRDSRVFKTTKGSQPYFIEAIVFDGNIGGRFIRDSIEVPFETPIASRQYIKSFPFTPKTFYIDVLDMRWKDKNGTQLDENGDWWTHTVKDPNQLKEVFEYYDKMR